MLHNHHDVNGHFPAGYDNVEGGSKGNWGWGAHIVPYVEQKNIYDTIGVTTHASLAVLLNNGGRRTAIKQKSPGFRCPSDTNQGAATNNTGIRKMQQKNSNTSHHIAMTNYVGCNSSGHLRNNDGNADGNANGIFVRDREFRFADITDGTSNTIAFGERARRIQDNGQRDCHAGVVYGARGNAHNGNDKIASCLGSLHYKINKGENNCKRSFSSLYPTGTQFYFADGSIHFITETVNHNTNAAVNSTLERLAARNDGAVVGDYQTVVCRFNRYFEGLGAVDNGRNAKPSD